MFTNRALILSLIIQIIAAETPCETPNGQEGNCIPINQCPSIFALFQSSISSTTATYLRQSQCGTAGVYPKVCCPLGSSLPPPKNETVLPGKTDCGFVTEPKIIGGNKTDIDEFPWLALLEYKLKSGRTIFKCGGALISKRYILTARHCLRKNLISVRLGEWNTTSNPDCIIHKFGPDCAPPVIDVPVEEQIPYEDKTSAQGDIGLLRLSREVEYTGFVSPICLPTAPEDLTQTYVGKKLAVAGWGATENATSSPIKLKVLVPGRPLPLCEMGLRETFQADINLHDGQLCAGGEEGKDSCFGDSGGPLMYNQRREWYVVGIVSFGPKGDCGQANRPGVYVKVAKYVRWIISNVKP